jgi:hypothetical protein
MNCRLRQMNLEVLDKSSWEDSVTHSQKFHSIWSNIYKTMKKFLFGLAEF